MSLAEPPAAEEAPHEGAEQGPADQRPAAGPPRYWAFLSYSHADRRQASWLHRALETYAVPRRLVGRPSSAGRIPPRLRPIFRDREELGAVSDLGERLRLALEQSAFLIVVCSPAAARSIWVDEEIREFLRSHGPERVFCVVVAGQPAVGAGSPEECLPPSLRQGAVDAPAGLRHERLATDLRPQADGRHRGLLKLVAGLFNVDLDDLVRRDLQRRNRQLVALSTASLAATGLMSALAITALAERDRAVAERKQAESLISFMIGDLSKKLELTGQLDVLDDIGRHALAYYAAERPGPQDTDALAGRARVLQVRGAVQEEGGDTAAASRSIDEATAITSRLLNRFPNNADRVFDHAQSEFYLGNLAIDRGDDAAALDRLAAYKRLAVRLVKLAPTNESLGELADADEGVGAELLRWGRVDEAIASIEEGLPISRRLALSEPGNRDRAWNLAQLYAWHADAQAALGRRDDALADRTKEAAIIERLIQRYPNDAQAAMELGSSRIETARLQIAKGEVAAGIAGLRSALHDMDGVIARSPDNVDFRRDEPPGFLLLAEALLRAGNVDEAWFDANRGMQISLADHSRSDIAVIGTLLIRIAAAQAANAGAQRGALAPAGAQAAQLRALLLKARRGGALPYYASEASLLAGDFASLSGDLRTAVKWWRDGASTLETFRASPAASRQPVGVLLRQLVLRLSSGNPPRWRPDQATVRRVGSPKTDVRRLVDYRW